MPPRTILAVVLLVVIAASGIVGWLLFRTTTRENPALGILRYHHFFGRITKVTIDSNRDGKADAQALFHWSRPFRDLTDVRQQHYELREDRNFDGEWDTWLFPVREDDPHADAVVFQVDLDSDGKPDWELEASDSQEGYERIRERRGF